MLDKKLYLPNKDDLAFYELLAYCKWWPRSTARNHQSTTIGGDDHLPSGGSHVRLQDLTIFEARRVGILLSHKHKCKVGPSHVGL